MSDRGVYIAIAGVLAAAAYILTTQDVQAATGCQCGGCANMSGNGFAINNPLNIRYLSSNAFNGQTGNHNGYGVYSSLALGVRAAGLQLAAYYRRGLTTVTQMVSTWAPSTENDTQAYINDVSARMQVDANEPLSWPEDEVSLIQAMAYHENGYNPMSDSDVQGYLNT